MMTVVLFLCQGGGQGSTGGDGTHTAACLVKVYVKTLARLQTKILLLLIIIFKSICAYMSTIHGLFFYSKQNVFKFQEG